MYFSTREEALRFMKRLRAGEATPCPKCGNAEPVPLHRKAGKSNNDRKCPACGEIYRTTNMMYTLSPPAKPA